jgi:hypothetical protein
LFFSFYRTPPPPPSVEDNEQILEDDEEEDTVDELRCRSSPFVVLKKEKLNIYEFQSIKYV